MINIDYDSYYFDLEGNPILCRLVNQFSDNLQWWEIKDILITNYRELSKIPIITEPNPDKLIHINSKTISPTADEMQPWWNPGREKFIVNRYRNYTYKEAESITPERIMFRPSESYLVLVLSCHGQVFEYLYHLDEDGNWLNVRTKEHIDKAVELLLAGIAVSDQTFEPISDFPF